MFKTGQKIFWRDPENETSGVYEVYEKTSDFTYLIRNGFSEAEVYEGEMYDLSQKVIFRKWVVNGVSLIALFPEQELDDRPCIVASYDMEDQWCEAEYDFVMNATIPANKDEYAELEAELRKAGYDKLEIIRKPLSVCQLLGMMDSIAHKLITSIYITDFTKHDRKSIVDSEAKRPFIWQVYPSGTWLYFLDEADWKKRLCGRIEAYKSSSIENLYFMFNEDEFYPVFEKTIIKMLNE